MDGLIKDYQKAMEQCLKTPEKHQEMANRAAGYARKWYDWDAKATYTRKLYDAVLQGTPLQGFTDYR
jgi:glycosyltransferase involved in cell wall biosynthesis